MQGLRAYKVFLALIATFGLYLNAADARAQVGNFCPGGGCNFDHPTFVNVYWDSSAAQWDTDVGGAASGETQAQLDAFVMAVAHSTFFAGLSQYGVNSIASAPSITTGSCAPAPANVDAAISGIDSLILCALTHASVTVSDQVIINVFLPPTVMNTGFCTPQADGSHAAALHGTGATFASPLYTLIPTTPACLSGAGILKVALTHEMAEAATDPDPQALSGWKVPFGSEVGDLCENLGTFPPTPLVFGASQQYWSNSAKACISGYAPSFTPAVTSSSVCGTGQDMRIVLNGSFGPPPWDLTAKQFSAGTLYVRAAIAHASTPGVTSWTAGNFLGAPPDTVDLNNLTWLAGAGPGGSDQITIHGFSPAYGSLSQIVRPGDTVTVTIENPNNGARIIAPVVAPFATQITVGVAPDIQAGATGGLTITARDAGGCAVENQPLHMSSSNGTLPSSGTTGADGTFFTTIHYPDVAGPYTVNVSSPANGSATTRVYPRLDSLQPPQGSTSGMQTVVLNGLGFDSSTSVSFGSNPANVQLVTPDHRTVTLLTPVSTLAGNGVGTVGISSTVNGVSAYGLQYEYLQSDVPIMQFLGTPGSTAKHSCKTGQIFVAAYSATGALESTLISLSAQYAALLIGNSKLKTAKVKSGSIVTIEGGGPITAVNLSHPSAKDTESFPVWPQSLCDNINALNSRISHLVAIKASPFKVFDPSGCAGDCGGPLENSVIWGDAELTTQVRNSVWMQGAAGNTLRETYEIQGVGEEAQRALVAQNPIVGVRSKTANTATFVGPMIEIKSRAAKESNAPIAAKTRISLALTSIVAGNSFAIVHLHDVGGRQAWVEESATTPDPERSVAMTEAKSTGFYALVRLDRLSTKLQNRGVLTNRAAAR